MWLRFPRAPRGQGPIARRYAPARRAAPEIPQSCRHYPRQLRGWSMKLARRGAEDCWSSLSRQSIKESFGVQGSLTGYVCDVHAAQSGQEGCDQRDALGSVAAMFESIGHEVGRVRFKNDLFERDACKFTLERAGLRSCL